mmetsp:Transcript_8045/g.15887  ORF Transcript_8045/g.15887 Transcript_8045/m.15887 type:complete len:89 (-) Transcript_8045:2320-2586(-)
MVLALAIQRWLVFLTSCRLHRQPQNPPPPQPTTPPPPPLRPPLCHRLRYDVLRIRLHPSFCLSVAAIAIAMSPPPLYFLRLCLNLYVN